MPTQVERSASTQARLRGAGGTCSRRSGYQAVTTGTIADRARMSRGPIYHQFGDRLGLFRAVLADLESEISTRVLRRCRVELENRSSQ